MLRQIIPVMGFMMMRPDLTNNSEMTRLNTLKPMIGHVICHIMITTRLCHVSDQLLWCFFFQIILKIFKIKIIQTPPHNVLLPKACNLL